MSQNLCKHCLKLEMKTDGRLTIYFTLTKFFLRLICDKMVCLVFSGRRRVSFKDLNGG